MRALTIESVSPQNAPHLSAADLSAADLDAPAGRANAPAWAIPDWRQVLSGQPADTALIEFLRYGITSAVALTFDFGTLVFLTEIIGVHYLLAAALGFSVGVLVAYSLSVRWVFRNRRLPHVSAERMLFVLIGAIGLALNEGIIFGLTELVSLPYSTSKLVSVGAVFFANFTLRKLFLFTGPSKPESHHPC